jgi:hypothetical protein
MTLPRLAAGVAGVALASLLAACGAGSAATGYAPVTSATPGATSDTLQMPGAPMQAPAQVAPAASGPASGANTVVPQAPATDFTVLARRFVALRNQGTQALAAIKGQASSTDLNIDKQLMATAATVFANYATQLHALAVPATMKADVESLARVVNTVQATFVQAAQVTSFDALNPFLQQLVNDRDDQLNATNVVEKDLGLPQSTPRP